MSMFTVLLVSIGVFASANALGLGGGGGGCGCGGGGGGGCGAPPSCISVPSIPIQWNQVPLPQFSLPSCGGGCGCGKRKKRGVPDAVVSGSSSDVIVPEKESAEVSNDRVVLCNNPRLRRVILKNLSEDPILSKSSIHSELKAKMRGEFIVICSQGSFSFVADSPSYCVDGSEKQTCSVFQTA